MLLFIALVSFGFCFPRSSVFAKPAGLKNKGQKASKPEKLDTNLITSPPARQQLDPDSHPPVPVAFCNVLWPFWNKVVENVRVRVFFGGLLGVVFISHLDPGA